MGAKCPIALLSVRRMGGRHIRKKMVVEGNEFVGFLSMCYVESKESSALVLFSERMCYIDLG